MRERRLWTSDEFGRMIDVGLLASRGYELIHGAGVRTRSGVRVSDAGGGRCGWWICWGPRRLAARGNRGS